MPSSIYTFCPSFPSVQHQRAAERIVGFFSTLPQVEAVLLTCSCARGKATRDSCLDMCVLAHPDLSADEQAELEEAWVAFYGTDPAFQALAQVGKYSSVDLAFHNGRFVPGDHGWTTGPDEFEVEIGNLLVYSVPLWERGDYLRRLKAQWLPYYDDLLRRERLAMVRRYGLNNLDHIALYVERGLYFQAFHRLYNAFGEFLQALFISQRTYPIAYDKWIREQIEEILGMPELYARLPRLFEIQHFESQEIARKGEELKRLWTEYVSDQPAWDGLVRP